MLLLLVPGFFYVTYQNFGNDPQWLWLLALHAGHPVRPAREHDTGARLGGCQAGAAARHRGRRSPSPRPRRSTSPTRPFRHLAANTEDYMPILPGLGRPRRPPDAGRSARCGSTRKVAMDLAGLSPSPPTPTPSCASTSSTSTARPGPTATSSSAPIAWFDALSADLKASGLTAGKTALPRRHPVVASGFTAPSEPLPGASPWYYGGLPGWAAADYLLVPLCPLSTKVRKLILDEVDEPGRRAHRGAAQRYVRALREMNRGADVRDRRGRRGTAQSCG